MQAAVAFVQDECTSFTFSVQGSCDVGASSTYGCGANTNTHTFANGETCVVNCKEENYRPEVGGTVYVDKSETLETGESYLTLECSSGALDLGNDDHVENDDITCNQPCDTDFAHKLNNQDNGGDCPTLLLHGDSCTLTCATGYTPRDGSEMRCTNGLFVYSSSGASASADACVENPCPSSDVPSSMYCKDHDGNQLAQVQGAFAPAAVCYLACNAVGEFPVHDAVSYSSSVQFDLTCVRGALEHDLAVVDFSEVTCKPICDLSAVANRRLDLRSTFTHNEQLGSNFGCQSGYSLLPAGTLTCVNGEVKDSNQITVSPTCFQDCDTNNIIGLDATQINRYVAHGTRNVDLQCMTGGPVYDRCGYNGPIKCENGVFVPQTDRRRLTGGGDCAAGSPLDLYCYTYSQEYPPSTSTCRPERNVPEEYRQWQCQEGTSIYSGGVCTVECKVTSECAQGRCEVDSFGEVFPSSNPLVLKCNGNDNQVLLNDEQTDKSGAYAHSFDLGELAYAYKLTPSVGVCMSMCSYFPYFGLHDSGNFCLCGYRIDGAQASSGADSETCGLACPDGDDSLPCGDSTRIMVYRTNAMSNANVLAQYQSSETESKRYYHLRATVSVKTQSLGTPHIIREAIKTNLQSLLENNVFNAANLDVSYFSTDNVQVLILESSASQFSNNVYATTATVVISTGIVFNGLSDPSILQYSGSAASTSKFSNWLNPSDGNVLSGATGAFTAAYSTPGGCWQEGMHLQHCEDGCSEQGMTTRIGASDALFEACGADVNAADITPECCFSMCIRDVTCQGVTWFSNDICELYLSSSNDGGVADPPMIVRDSSVPIGRVAARLRACSECSIVGYDVSLDVGSSVTSVSISTSTRDDYNSFEEIPPLNVECGSKCSSCAMALWRNSDPCQQVADASRVERFEPVLSRNDEIPVLTIFADELCKYAEDIRRPCRLPAAIYATCTDEIDGSIYSDGFLPSGKSCTPNCAATGFEPNVERYACDRGQITITGIANAAQAMCLPMGCQLDQADVFCDGASGKVESGETCDIRCSDSSLRPDVPSLECLNGALLGLSTIECSTPCALPGANAIACEESNVEILSGSSCTPTCSNGNTISSVAQLSCDQGIFTPASYSCVRYVKLKEKGHIQTLDKLLVTYLIVDATATIETASQSCLISCAEYSDLGQTCLSASISELSVGRFICTLFAESAHVSVVDKDSTSRSFNVGDESVRSVETDLGSISATIAGVNQAPTCPAGFVDIVKSDGTGMACAFSNALSECYSRRCPNPLQTPCSQSFQCIGSTAQYTSAYGSSESCIADNCDASWWASCENCQGICLFVVDEDRPNGDFACNENANQGATHCAINEAQLRASRNIESFECDTNNLLVGGTCPFACKSNYFASGNGVLDCYVTGLLEAESCKKACSTVGAMPGTHSCGPFIRHGETCNFQCAVNYEPSGSGSVSCDNGDITPSTAGQTCVYTLGCEDVSTSLESSVAGLQTHDCGSTLLNGDSCTGTCMPGYDVTVQPRVSCANRVKTVIGTCTKSDDYCGPNKLLARISNSVTVKCDEIQCTLTECQSGYGAESAVMSCGNGNIVEDGDLAACQDVSIGIADPCNGVSSNVWFDAMIKRGSLDSNCADTLSHGDTCAFDCLDGFRFLYDSGSSGDLMIECDNKVLSLRAPGDCVKRPCEAQDVISNNIATVLQLTDGDEGIRRIECDTSISNCRAACEGGYDSTQTEIRCTRRAGGGGLVLYDVPAGLAASSYCTPKACQVNLNVENMISHTCGSERAHGETCTFTCGVGTINVGDELTCDRGSLVGTTQSRCSPSTEIIEQSAAFEADAENVIINYEIVVTTSATSTLTASIIDTTRANILGTCHAVAQDNFDEATCQDARIVSIGDSEIKVLLTVSDIPGSTFDNAGYRAVRANLNSIIIERLRDEINIVTFESVSESSTWVEIGRDARRLGGRFSGGAYDDVSAEMCTDLNVDVQSFFGKNGASVRFEGSASRARAAWSENLDTSTLAGTESFDVLSVVMMDATGSSQGAENCVVIFRYADDSQSGGSGRRRWLPGSPTIDITIGEDSCAQTVVTTMPTNERAGIARCVGTPPGVGLRPVHVVSVGSAASLRGRHRYFLYEMPTIDSLSFIPTAPNVADSMFTIFGAKFGPVVQNQEPQIMLSLSLTASSISENVHVCAESFASFGRCEVHSNDISRVDADEIRVNVSSLFADAGWDDVAMYGSAAADVVLYVDAMPAFLSASSANGGSSQQWPVVSAEPPVVTSIEPSTGSYRGQLVTLSGYNFGHTEPLDCASLSVYLGISVCDITGDEAGWLNDTSLVCEVLDGDVNDDTATVRLERSGLGSSNSLVFTYLGDFAPLTEAELSDVIDSFLSMNNAAGEIARVAVTCANSGKQTVLSPPAGTSAEALKRLIETTCSGDVVQSVEVLSKQEIQVSHTEALGDYEFCTGGDVSSLPFCDTVGTLGQAYALAIVGENFLDDSGFSNVQSVDVESFGQIPYRVNSTNIILIEVPPGSGSSIAVVVTSSDGYIDSSASYSYHAPVVKNVRGCDASILNPERTDDCSRDTDIAVTITGRYFGPITSPVQVLVGGSLCINVQRNATHFDSTLTCDILKQSEGEALQTGWLPTSVLALNQISQPKLSIRYDACPVGTNYQCVCRRGYFGVTQDVVDAFLPYLNAGSSIDALVVQTVLNSMWPESAEHDSLERYWEPLSDFVSLEFEEFDTDGNGTLSADEILELVVDFNISQPLTQCYACRLGMTCYNLDDAIVGLDVTTVEAMPGYWNDRQLFFEGTDSKDWGTLNFKRCDASSEDVVVILIMIGLYYFNVVVNAIDGVLDTGDRPMGSRTERLLRLRREYKQSKRGKRRRSTFSVVPVTPVPEDEVNDACDSIPADKSIDDTNTSVKILPHAELSFLIATPTKAAVKGQNSDWHEALRSDVFSAQESGEHDHFYHRDPPEKPYVWTKVKILVSYFQVVFVLQEQAQITWPSSYLNIIRPLRIFDFDLFSLPYFTCIFESNFWARFWMQMLIPPILIAVVFGLSKFSCDGPVRRWTITRQYAWRLSLAIQFLVYTTVVRMAFDALHCEEFASGRYFLYSDLSIECYVGQHQDTLPVVYILLIIYGVGTPALFAYLCAKAHARKELYNRAGPVDAHGRAMEVNAETRSWLGIAYSEYRQHCWWFEGAIFSYKFVLIAMMTFTSPASTMLYNCIGVISLFAFTFKSFLEPYRVAGDGRLALACQLCLVLVFALSVSIDMDMHTNIEDNSFAATWISIITLSPLLFAIVAILNAWRKNPHAADILRYLHIPIPRSLDLSTHLREHNQDVERKLEWFEERLDVARFNSDCVRMMAKVARNSQRIAIQLERIDPHLARLDLATKSMDLVPRVKRPDSADGESNMDNAESAILCKILEETLQHVAAYAITSGAMAGDIMSLNVARKAVARILFALAPWEIRHSGRGCWGWYDIMDTRVKEVTPEYILELALALREIEIVLRKLTGIRKRPSRALVRSSEFVPEEVAADTL
eukprot:g789.t1